MNSVLDDAKRKSISFFWVLFVALLVLSIDFIVVRPLDHFVYEWPGVAAPLFFPFWASLPRFAYYLIVGYVASRLLRLALPGAAAFLVMILTYYAVFRFGTYYIYGGFLSYLVAYLPVACVPLGYVVGYLSGRYGSEIRRLIVLGLRTKPRALWASQPVEPVRSELSEEVSNTPKEFSKDK